MQQEKLPQVWSNPDDSCSARLRSEHLSLRFRTLESARQLTLQARPEFHENVRSCIKP